MGHRHQLDIKKQTFDKLGDDESKHKKRLEKSIKRNKKNNLIRKRIIRKKKGRMQKKRRGKRKKRRH